MSDYPENNDFEEGDEADFPTSLYLEIIDEQDEVPVERDRVQSVCEQILSDAGITSGRIGIVIVDNDTIQELNKNFLQHDYPTDVISFQLESSVENGYLEGEVIANAQIAKLRAPDFLWGVHEELTLYIIHGLLHLVGFDDMDAPERKAMREKERYYLRFAGYEPNDLGFEEDEKDADDEVEKQNENSSESSNCPGQEESEDENKSDFFQRFRDDDTEKN